MKRTDLVRKLEQSGCVLVRHLLRLLAPRVPLKPLRVGSFHLPDDLALGFSYT
jgi:hypothetical protein